jgi:hypothetical protein
MQENSSEITSQKAFQIPNGRLMDLGPWKWLCSSQADSQSETKIILIYERCEVCEVDIDTSYCEKRWKLFAPERKADVSKQSTAEKIEYYLITFERVHEGSREKLSSSCKLPDDKADFQVPVFPDSALISLNLFSLHSVEAATLSNYLIARR